MSKVNFKEGVKLKEGVRIENGVDFKNLYEISAKNSPKASLWANSFRYGMRASKKENKIKPQSEYEPEGRNKWTVVAVLPEGSAVSQRHRNLGIYSQKLNLFKSNHYSRRCTIKAQYTRPEQLFSNKGRMHKFLKGNNVGTGPYNQGLVGYVSRPEATLENKPEWEKAKESAPLYSYSETKKDIFQITPAAAINLLGDDPIFKFIMSPEDPNVDFHQFCVRFISKLNNKFNCKLKWCASNHYNTEHPHVHLLVCRQTEDGRLLRLDSDCIKKGLKKISEEILTDLQGPVFWEEELENINKDVKTTGFCFIDRKILAMARTNPADPTRIPAHRIANSDSKTYLQVFNRLKALNRRGLVKYEKYDKDDPQKQESCWFISKDFESNVRKAEFAEVLGIDVSDFVVDKGHKNYKCSLLEAKRLRENPSRVFLALVDENGIKHLREENLDEELEVPIGVPGEVFELKELKEMLEQRSRELLDD